MKQELPGQSAYRGNGDRMRPTNATADGWGCEVILS
jgi:hypothetical protein